MKTFRSVLCWVALAMAAVSSTTSLAAPKPVLSSTYLDFGLAPIGKISASKIVTLRNEGDADLNIISWGLGGFEFMTSGDSCDTGRKIPPGHSCYLSFAFTPDTIGRFSKMVTIHHNGSPDKTTISLYGDGYAESSLSPRILVEPKIVTEADWREDGITVVKITNSGNLRLKIEDIHLDGWGSVDHNCADRYDFIRVLMPGDSCTVGLGAIDYQSWHPSFNSPTTLVIKSNSPDGIYKMPVYKSSSTDYADAPGRTNLILTSSGTQFGAIPVGSVSSMVLTAHNIRRNTPILLNEIRLKGPEFQVAQHNCPIVPDTMPPGSSCSALVTFNPASHGDRKDVISFVLRTESGLPSPVATWLNGLGVGGIPAREVAKRKMIEYEHTSLSYYFQTSRGNEQAFLDSLPDWKRTGFTFTVYAHQAAGTQGIRRFYFDQIAKQNSRGTHFYSLLENDYFNLATLNPFNQLTPRLPYHEDIDSYAFLPIKSGISGHCASGLQPVYRVFRGNERFPDDPNHRFTTSTSLYNQLVAAGWEAEGVNFCVPPN